MFVCEICSAHAYVWTKGRATMFTTASRKKEKKPASSKPNGHTNGNADTGGFVGTDAFSGRGGFRGGRGGSRGGRGGSGESANFVNDHYAFANKHVDLIPLR